MSDSEKEEKPNEPESQEGPRARLIKSVRDVLHQQGRAVRRCQQWWQETEEGYGPPPRRVRLELVDAALMGLRIAELLEELGPVGGPTEQYNDEGLDRESAEQKAKEEEKILELSRLHRHLDELLKQLIDREPLTRAIVDKGCDGMLQERAKMYDATQRDVLRAVRGMAGSGGIVGCSLNPIMCIACGIATLVSQAISSNNASNAAAKAKEWQCRKLPVVYRDKYSKIIIQAIAMEEDNDE